MARCCIVLYHIVFRYVSLIFPFVKRRTSGKRSNKERINDDASTAAHTSFFPERGERTTMRECAMRVGLVFLGFDVPACRCRGMSRQWRVAPGVLFFLPKNWLSADCFPFCRAWRKHFLWIDLTRVGVGFLIG